MLLVIPVSHGDLSLALLNLRLATRLDAACPFPCLISAPHGVDLTELTALARPWVGGQPPQYRYTDWRGAPDWPRPQNWAWQETARYVASLSLAQPWLWWEADATPLRRGWLQTLAAAHKAGAKPFTGHLVNGGHLNGVAIYPPDVRPYSSAAFLARSAPFDRVLSESLSPRLIHPINDLLGHYLKPPGRPSLPITTAKDARALLATPAVLYHGSSDGALARFLLDPASLPEVAPVSLVPPHTASFTEQTKWESGYFAFPTTPSTAYFNSGLCEHDGSLHLFTRRWRYSQHDPSWKGSDNTSDLAIWRIRSNMTLASPPLIPTLPLRHPLEQWEDPRVSIGSDGRARVSFVTWVHKRPWTFHQVLARLSPDWHRFDSVLHPAYGGNGPSLASGTAHEKNWTWFEHDGAWHCRYAINPSNVFAIDVTGTVTAKWRQPDRPLPWTHSLPLRGGTPPVRVGSEYISFFHSYLPWNGTRRRYFMGAFAFAARPPFALTRITRSPLLAGSESDFMALPNALPCIFASGALLRDREWLVTFGVNDEACGWLRIPAKALDKLLVSL